MEFISTFSGILAMIICRLAIPVCIIFAIILALKKQDWKKPLKIAGILFVVTILLVVVGVSAFSSIEDNEEIESAILIVESEQIELKETEVKLIDEMEMPTETEEVAIETQVEVVQTEIVLEEQKNPETELIEDSVNLLELSEEEYKESCKHIYYDEVFFGEEDLKGELVKINLFVSEEYFFSINDMYNDSVHEFYTEYNLHRDFLKCCVLREDANSYVGSQMNLYFTQNYDLNPSDYESGDKITIYGEVVSYSTNTWDGYNEVSVIPKYIEEE